MTYDTNKSDCLRLTQLILKRKCCQKWFFIFILPNKMFAPAQDISANKYLACIVWVLFTTMFPAIHVPSVIHDWDEFWSLNSTLQSVMNFVFWKILELPSFRGRH